MKAADFGLAFALGMTALAAPALADVKKGVDAWERGDYPAAVKEWRPLAIKGDADAQFNLAQAYRFGRAVPQDMKQAEEWYAKAARQGHAQAEDNLGLIKFQGGDRAGAIPYIERSAARGDPRAQYVLGTALFNGDIIAKDWVRAYALMTRASAAGLPSASSSLAQMDKFIPVTERQRGLAMARDLEMNAQRPAVAMAPSAPVRAAPPVETRPIPKPAGTAPVRTASVPPSRWSLPGSGALPPPPRARRPQPAPVPAETVPEDLPEIIEPAPVEAPPGATYDPAPAYTPPPRPVARPMPRPAPVKVVPKPKPAAVAATPKPAPGGKWRVQLGAFSTPAAAKAQWSRLASSGGVRGLQPYLVKAGAITRLQAGPLASRAAAEKACKGVSGGCLVVAP